MEWVKEVQMKKVTAQILIRDFIKTGLQFVLLPIIYNWYKKKKIQENLVIFADSKNDGIPYSMLAMHKLLKGNGIYDIKNVCMDFSKLTMWNKITQILNFMKLYANAKYVFICDYFLPVSSCRKRKETKVIQLWHASSVLKKFGYDAEGDLGHMRFCRPTGNFDVVSVPSEAAKKVFERAWRLDENIVKVFGMSRTDLLFDEEYNKQCADRFYKSYPDAKGKTIILWAPTFRGDGIYGELKGYDAIQNLKENLPSDCELIIEIHPHLKNKYQVNNCDMKTEELYSVADLLITDYSSVLFDFIMMEKRIVLFAPDMDSYMRERGLYVNIEQEFDIPVVRKADALAEAVRQQLQNKRFNREYDEYKRVFLQANDGHSSERILRFLQN